jgi:Lamin Tail Domain
MRERKSIFRWLSAWLLLVVLGVGALGGAGLSVHAAPRQANALDVVINEVAWGGTAASQTDEWIELYNPGGVSINLTGWQLVSSDGNPKITLTGNIPANGYFLLERTDDNTVSDLKANQIYTGDLNDSGEVLTLRDASSNVIDTANNENGGSWPQGSGSPGYFSMERIAIAPDTDANWKSNDGVTRNGLDASGNPINGTPTNSVPSEVIISEVAWAGTKAYSGDEWIELYYPPGSGPNPLSLDGWILTNESGSVYISFDSNDDITSGNFFLIERGSGNATSELEDKTYVSGSLSDSGEKLYLLDNTRAVIDTANSDGGSWPAGGGTNFSSMERVIKSGVVEPDGKFAWITNVGTVRNGQDAAGNDIYGTPGQPNWAFTVGPTATPAPTKTPAPFNTLSVAINEVAWAGTKASPDDEWIELYNPGNADIDLTGWKLQAADGSPSIALSGVIDAGAYFLLERTDDDTVENVAADLIYSGALSNSGEILRLYDPTNKIIDTANSNGGAWPAGTSSSYASMERGALITDTDRAWVTYHSTTARTDPPLDSGGNEIQGTPGSSNLPFNVTATAAPVTAYPTYITVRGTQVPYYPGGVAVPLPILGISEFLPRPGHDWNNDGKVDVFDEFIEIINAGQVDVNLRSYQLDDEQNQGSPPYTLPNVTLKAGDRAVFYASETGINLSDAGDTVRLLSGGKVVDAYTYGPVRYPDEAWCRIPDRLGYWNEPCFPTPGNPNALTGTVPLPPGASTGYHAPLCLFPDTTPEEFVYAECQAGGDGIWNRKYWDGTGFYEWVIPGDSQKWNAFVE